MISAMLLLGSAVAGSPVAAYRCDGGGSAEPANIATAYDSYARHSVQLVRAAMQGDATALQPWVGADAGFTVFYGDVGKGPRTTGVQAAIEFFSELEATNFEWLSASSGPFSIDPCGKLVSAILLRKEHSDQAFDLKFEYMDGKLIKVVGSAASVVEGSLVEAVNG